VSDTFRVLHVCTGNIGRSAMAERLMSVHLAATLGGEATGFELASAGTHGVVGAAMEPYAAQALSDLGGDPTGFRARQLDASVVRAADLVLTATREHRSVVVGLEPATLRKAFTLRELARLSASVPLPGDLARGSAARAHAAVAGAWVARGQLPAAPGEDDVLDPIGMPESYYRDRAAEIDLACRQVVSLLTGLRR
jgi:protein-tyrosine phosphatase